MSVETAARHANTLETMLAKEDIRGVLARYARGVDRADAELLRSCYHPDAIEEHGPTYSGPATDYIDGAMERMRALKHPMAHYLASSHIELEGEVAFVETYVLTFARFEKDGEPWDTLTGGRLFDRFERRGGEWRIARRTMAFDWNRDAPAAESWCVGLFDTSDPRMVMGRRGREDLSYSRF
ncbi:MAG: nuclear transport factor 2 family protein [Caulobacterales bacterium]|nr:nuclear transport factor 2 family protein [Caulobacterales bacterium]